MKINKKHVISLVLALAMVLSCMPAITLAASAEETTLIPGRKIIVGYDDYMGAGWKDELIASLPATYGDKAVTWPSVDMVNPDKVDFYHVPGTVDGVANAVQCVVQVCSEESANLITNGDFEDGETGWTGRNLAASTDPLNSDNAVVRARNKAANSGSQFLYQSNRVGVMDGVKACGAGEYVFKMDILSGAYDSSNEAKEGVEIYLSAIWYSVVDDSNSTTNGYVTDDTRHVVLKNEWNTYQHQFTVSKSNLENAGFRTDIKVNTNSETYWALFMDNVKLFPLNTAMTEVPASITGVADTLTPIAIVKDYDTYVKDWKAGLNLPATVTVTVSDGTTDTVEVVWDYAPLDDLSVTGRYVLTGKLSTLKYTNYNGLTVQQVVLIREKINLAYNGDFANREGATSAKTAPGWTFGWSQTVMKNPDDAEDYLALLKKSSTTTGSTLLMADTTGQDELNKAIKSSGIGQYYMQFDAISVPYSDAYTANTDVTLWIRMQYSGESVLSDNTVILSTEEWTTYGKQFNVEDLDATFKLDLRGKSQTTYSAVYVDNIEVFPLRVELAETPALPIKYASVDLSNSLDMNFYIDETVLADVASAKIVHTYADGTTDEQVKALSDISVDGEGESYITYNDIAAKEMGDSITVTLYNSEGTAIAVWMDSMVDYLARISDQISGDLYTDLQNYGAAAQNYFGYNNSNVSISIRDVTPTKNSNGPAEWTGSTLTLESNILMEVFFAKNALTGDETATVTYTTHAGTPVSKEVSLVLDDYYDEWKVQIDGLAIADVSTVVTVTVGGFTVTDSMESYVARQLEKGETDDIYKAILAVGASAKAYFESL